ncbi:MAG: hypothetical protein HeimC3_26230 [Candidatus Heimdallarchaeota archaeon LC_3]|nr:MAG: hypothetical protein HeimC3_26230 [Candidatus Heimdallarchaeota archaeon LC_3]
MNDLFISVKKSILKRKPNYSRKLKSEKQFNEYLEFLGKFDLLNNL